MPMTVADGERVIRKHAGQPQPGVGYVGLLARLRPFVGLDDADFLDLLEALAAVAPQLNRDELDRELVASLWDICRTARFWAKGGGPPGPELQVIPLVARRRLDVWVDELERIILELMTGEPPWWAFLNTAWVSVRQRYGDRAGFLVPLWADGLTELLADEDANGPAQAADMRVLCEAIGGSGAAGTAAAGVLQAVIGRTGDLTVKRAAARAAKAVGG